MNLNRLTGLGCFSHNKTLKPFASLTRTRYARRLAKTLGNRRNEEERCHSSCHRHHFVCCFDVIFNHGGKRAVRCWQLPRGLVRVHRVPLAWFMPGLVAGFLSHGKPFIVGSFLGLMIMVFDFSAAVVIFGWDWALALIGLFPASQLFLLMSAVVFAYAGWKIQEIATQGPPKNVA